MELNQTQKILFGEGWVWHSRPESSKQRSGIWSYILRNLKLENTFRYPIFNLLVPIHTDDAYIHLKKGRCLSLSAENYLNSQPGLLRENFFQFLENSTTHSYDEVWLQTLPSLFGYVFNPVSFWYCYNKGQLSAVLCEVNNTFGDRHFYFIHDPTNNSHNSKTAPKRFHVSPFMDNSGFYTFEFDISDKDRKVRICLFDSEKNLKLDTWIKLRFRNLDEISLYYILKKYGWLTAMVTVRIHFQALKLWLKGAKFFKRPTPPKENVTHASTKI